MLKLTLVVYILSVSSSCCIHIYVECAKINVVIVLQNLKIKRHGWLALGRQSFVSSHGTIVFFCLIFISILNRYVYVIINLSIFIRVRGPWPAFGLRFN